MPLPRKPTVEPGVVQPYVGPRPFERTEGDKERFFARDREAEEIAALITAAHRGSPVRELGRGQDLAHQYQA